jgi:hypothetical protein
VMAHAAQADKSDFHAVLRFRAARKTIRTGNVQRLESATGCATESPAREVRDNNL